MKVGEVYQKTNVHSILIYVVIIDYGTLRPLVLRSTWKQEDELYPLSINMAAEVCKSVMTDNLPNFYNGAEKIADSLEEYICNNVTEGILLGEK